MNVIADFEPTYFLTLFFGNGIKNYTGARRGGIKNLNFTLGLWGGYFLMFFSKKTITMFSATPCLGTKNLAKIHDLENRRV